MDSEAASRLEKRLEERCKSWKYLITVFLLTTTPGLYNALHITVYVFMTLPTQQTCLVARPLLDGNFSFEQTLRISAPGGDACRAYSWDYDELALMGFDEAENYTSQALSSGPVPTQPCLGYLYPPDKPMSVIQQWDLVCERSYLVSLVQVAVAFGKFIGAFCFGVVADKFGRKRCFCAASLLYVFAGPLAAWTSHLYLFLLLRFVLGLAGSAVYETGYVLLSELTVGKWRSRLSCVYGIFYSVGMLLLPPLAFYFPDWYRLQLFISLPTFLILINCWMLTESPRWLLVKGRTEEAWTGFFEDRTDTQEPIQLQTSLPPLGSSEPMLDKPHVQVERGERQEIWYNKFKAFLKEASQIFRNSELRNRALICNFSWFIASLCYYVIALNGVNLTSNLYLYIILNGVFEAPGYLLPVILISYLGRRSASVLFFLVTGLSLLLILAIPEELEGLRTGWAMMGRLWVSSVFSFITLHTSELFPTSNRNTAIGMTLTMSQIGSMSAPLLVQLGSSGWYIPSTACGALAVIAGSLVLLLPETRDEPLSDTIQDVEKSNKVSLSNCCSPKGNQRRRVSS